MNKIRLGVVAAIATLLLVISGSAANAYSNNVVYNRYDSTGNVWVSGGGSYRVMYPDYDSLHVGIANVTCFYPTKNARSQWGGLYTAYQIRCFQSSNNTLILKVG